MISLVSPETLYPLVREHIAGAMDFMIRRALVEAAREFCRESHLVQEIYGPVSLAGGDSVSLIPADLPYTGRQIICASEGREELTAGVDYQQVSGNELRIHRDIAAFSVIFVVEPRLTATRIPAVLVDDYPQALACGAVERMASMPGKAWSSPQLAQIMRPFFIDGYRDAYRWRTENTVVNTFRNPVVKQDFF